MSKRILSLLACFGLLLIGAVYSFAKTPSFTCRSQFSVAQNINNDNIRAEGIIFINLEDDRLLLNIDGLLTHNDKKYLISRTLRMKYKMYNANSHLYKLISIKTVRDSTDNIDDKIANDLLFGKGTQEKLIFLNILNNNVILFGNHAFPQYGCKRN